MADPQNKPTQSAPSAVPIPEPARPDRTERKANAARIALLSNTVLMLLKLIVGFGTGSVSVLSEAVHSATDLLASGIAFFSVRVSDDPPDEDHPYGHGKIENMSGLAEALLIFAAAGFIVYEAVGKLAAPAARMGSVNAGLVVMGLSAGVNFFLSQHLKRVAQQTDSMALAADAAHLQTDILTSVGVLIGLALARLTARAWFDPLTALLMTLFILFTGYRLLRDTLPLLLDARLPAEEEVAIRETLDADARVLSYHKLRTRKSGSYRYVDVHVMADDDCTLVEAHDLAETLEDRIREALPAVYVTIHMEPFHAEMRHQQEEAARRQSAQTISDAAQTAVNAAAVVANVAAEERDRRANASENSAGTR